MAIWLDAIRPKTLPAGAAPVLVGVGFAWGIDAFQPLPALAALFGALLLQIGTNLANDYFDHAKGADTPDRAGPTRATAAGLVPPETMKRAAFATFGAAALVGLYLVWVGGLPILIIGLAGIASGILYTGGPKPLGYIGLGDLFVFVFFGPIAVAGTVYVQSLTWDMGAILWGIPLGLLATAILAVNNLRDIPTDAAAGKRTLAVRLGERVTRWYYLLLILAAFAIPFVIGHVRQDIILLAPVVTVMFAASSLLTVWRPQDDRRAYNRALAGTARTLLAYALVLAGALAWS